jgi:predicted phage gp36 major capsid-like protein
LAPAQAPDRDERGGASSEAARVQAHAQEQPDLSDKLRGDWEAIKRDNRAAGDEIRKAFRDLWEKLSR